MSTMMVIGHRVARTVRFEQYDDIAEALARFHSLKLAGAKQLVMYEATLIAEGDDE